MTSYSEIFTRFLAKCTDYSLAQMPEEDALNMLNGYLDGAIVNFIRPSSDLSQRDKELQTFNVELVEYEKEVLARLMLSEWLQPQITSATLTLQAFNARESHSQAAHLKQLIELQQNNDIKIKKLLRDKSYEQNEYFD